MDKYDKAIKYLTKNPQQIVRAWREPKTHPGGSLFGFCGKNTCGCLTQIRMWPKVMAETPALTNKIRHDVRIPARAYDILVSDLPVFAEWQRKLDRYAFRRKAVAR